MFRLSLEVIKTCNVVDGVFTILRVDTLEDHVEARNIFCKNTSIANLKKFKNPYTFIICRCNDLPGLPISISIQKEVQSIVYVWLLWWSQVWVRVKDPECLGVLGKNSLTILDVVVKLNTEIGAVFVPITG